MRVYITNDKITLVELVNVHLLQLLQNRRVEVIINGSKRVGTVDDVKLDDTKDFLLLSVDGKDETIPILDETKARFGKELVVFETKSHTTVIEIIE